MTITEYFDPTNKEHLQAFRTLQETGTWPNNFPPQDCTFSSIWQIEIYSKIANIYILFAFSGKIEGV
jgi:hypothetical protein